MSTAFQDISAALSANLNTYAAANSIPVAWENVKYLPVTGAKYLRETLIPSSTEQVELGAAGIDETLGIYQVDAFTPAHSDLGKSEAQILADGVANQFKRGALLTYNGVNVRIRKVSPGGGAIDGAWYMIPITIEFKSYTQPRV